MELDEFIEKFLPDYEDRFTAWVASYGNRPITISQRKYEFYILRFPEALQNYTDIICDMQRKECAIICGVEDYESFDYDEQYSIIYNAEQPKVEYLWNEN